MFKLPPLLKIGIINIIPLSLTYVLKIYILNHIISYSIE